MLKNCLFKFYLRLLVLINSNNYTMKTKFNGFLTLFLALVVQISFAQQKTISGVVTDASGTLPGVSVIVKGSSNGTETDFDGKFSISAKVGDVIVFRYLGYQTVERTVGSQNTINVKMAEDNTVLEEIVVTGYSSTSKVKLATASSQVSAKNIENRPSTSIAQTLTGQVPGLFIATSSGQPGANSLVQLRGVNSINGNTEPLFIMDGVPINEDNFRSLNQNEIESITVLKDAGATAIYGSRGANGVIVIKTKNGKKGSPLKVQYTGLFSISSLQGDRYDRMNSQQYLTYEREKGVGWGAGLNVGPSNPGANVAVVENPFGRPLTDAEIAATPTTDWEKFFMRDGITQNHNLTLSSGSETMTQFTSINFTDIQGTLRQTDLSRFSFRNNITGGNDKFTYSSNISLNYSKNDEVSGIGGNGVNQNPFFGAAAALPYLRPDQQPTSEELSNNFFVAFGPFYIQDKLQTNTNLEEELKVIANLSGTYNFTDELSASLTMGVDYESVFDLDVADPISRNQLRFNRQAPGSSRQDSDRRFTFNSTSSLNWAKQIDKHSFDVGAYLEYFKGHRRFFGYFVQGLNPKTFFPGDGAGFIPDNPNDDFAADSGFASRNDAGLLSYFSIANYDYDSKYGISASVRRDASYRFASTNRWATFWSVSGRWNIDKEPWMEDSVFNSLKLRASYGTTGNQRIVDGNIFTAPDLAFNFFGTGTGYLGQNTINLTQIGNDQLRWETVAQLNVGVDFSLFNRRLTGSVDYYRKKTTDLFQNLPISGVNGQYRLRSNTGELNNNGIDVELSYDLIKNENFNFRLNVVGNYNENYLDDLPSETGFIEGIGRNGGPLGEYRTVRYAGVNPANGNLLFLDANDNLTESPNADTDRVWLNQNIIPDAQGSFGFDIDYKGFFFTTQFQYQIGTDLFDGDYARLVNDQNLGILQLSSDVLRAWTPDNRITDIPRYQVQNANFASTRFLTPTDFIRLRFASLGYNVPKQYLNNTGLTNLRLFLQGENLFTITKFRGFDAASRVTGLQFPTPRIFSFGIEVGL